MKEETTTLDITAVCAKLDELSKQQRISNMITLSNAILEEEGCFSNRMQTALSLREQALKELNM